MRRLPVAAFVALAIATIAAFFVTQHLKVSTPLLTGAPAPQPSAINPIDGRACLTHTHRGVRLLSHRRMFVSFYLLNRSDDVDVYIVNSDGEIIKTIASGVHMQASPPKRGYFSWDGRTQNGSIAPDGNYYIRVSLIHQGRSVLISNNSGAEPVTVLTVPTAAPDHERDPEHDLRVRRLGRLGRDDPLHGRGRPAGPDLRLPHRLLGRAATAQELRGRAQRIIGLGRNRSGRPARAARHLRLPPPGHRQGVQRRFLPRAVARGRGRHPPIASRFRRPLEGDGVASRA